MKPIYIYRHFLKEMKKEKRLDSFDERHSSSLKRLKIYHPNGNGLEVEYKVTDSYFMILSFEEFWPRTMRLLACSIRPFGEDLENNKYTSEYTDKIIKLIFPKLKIDSDGCQELVRELNNFTNEDGFWDYIEAFKYLICYFHYNYIDKKDI